MNKIFVVQLIDTLNRIAMTSKSKTIDLNSKANAAKIFRTLYRLGIDIYGYDFANRLSKAKITDGEDLKQLILSDEFKNELMNDRQGMFLIKRIKLPTKAAIAQEMKVLRDKYKNQISTDENDVDDPIHTYAVRTNPYGLAPDLFVDGVKSEEGRREVRRLYAWMYKVNYFKVRECSFEWYLKHKKVDGDDSDIEYNDDDLYRYEDKMSMDENLIESINTVNESFNDKFGYRGGKRRMIDNMSTKRFNKYHKFDDLEDDFDEFDDFEDMYNRNDTDDFYGNLDDDIEQDVFESSENETFVKGDMVEKVNGSKQGFIVIDVLESDADIDAAKRKRRYRTIFPKGFEVSSETPALAVMTMKGEKGGLNFIYPASEFVHIN